MPSAPGGGAFEVEGQEPRQRLFFANVGRLLTNSGIQSAGCSCAARGYFDQSDRPIRPES